jgi:hypothetical protein
MLGDRADATGWKQVPLPLRGFGMTKERASLCERFRERVRGGFVAVSRRSRLLTLIADY